MRNARLSGYRGAACMHFTEHLALKRFTIQGSAIAVLTRGHFSVLSSLRGSSVCSSAGPSIRRLERAADAESIAGPLSMRGICSTRTTVLQWRVGHGCVCQGQWGRGSVACIHPPLSTVTTYPAMLSVTERDAATQWR